MNSGVYIIKNNVTGKVYVGSSQNLSERWYKHRQLLRRGCHTSIKLQRSWNKYGEFAFSFEVMLYCAPEDCLRNEQTLLDAFDAVDSGYNIAKEAGAPMRGRKHTEETKKQMSNKKVGVPKTDEHKQNISEACKHRRPVTEETRAKIVAAWTIRRLTPVSEETRKKLSEAGMGRKLSPEHVMRLVASNHARAGKPGTPLTPEHKQKLIDANHARKGKPIDPEKAEAIKKKKQDAWARRREEGTHTKAFTGDAEAPVGRAEGPKPKKPRVFTEDWRQRISDGVKKAQTPEYLKAQSDAKIGKPLTSEHRQKISAGLKSSANSK
jgi:group I intron endonuclease